MADQRRPDLGKTKVDYERLGKAVEDALIQDYIYVLHSTKRQVWSSFVRGIFAGIGGVLGATLGIAVLIGLLQIFGGVPVIGEYVRSIQETIQNR